MIELPFFSNGIMSTGFLLFLYVLVTFLLIGIRLGSSDSISNSCCWISLLVCLGITIKDRSLRVKVKGTGLIGNKVRLGASVRQAWRRGNKVVAYE